VIFFIALLIAYPWYILSAGSVLYIVSLPLGFKSYRDHARAAAALAAGNAGAPASGPPGPSFQPAPSDPEERPERLH
jgi:CDP-diacylglycerol---serine O-phosphatidyltransferase